MPQSARDNTKRRATQTGTLIGVRLQPDALAQLDVWIAAQPEPRPSRPEAIRRLTAERLNNCNRLPAQNAPRPAGRRPVVGRGER